MDYKFLSSKFFDEYDEINYPEIERKDNRPYIMITVQVNEILFGIPLRSGISHPNVFWTNKPLKRGADYSKVVIIKDSSFIDNDREPHIRSEEFNILKGKDYEIRRGLEKYIEDYKKALKEIHIERNKKLCNFSTLQYFHKELNIDICEDEELQKNKEGTFLAEKETAATKQ